MSETENFVKKPSGIPQKGGGGSSSSLLDRIRAKQQLSQSSVASRASNNVGETKIYKAPIVPETQSHPLVISSPPANEDPEVVVEEKNVASLKDEEQTQGVTQKQSEEGNNTIDVEAQSLLSDPLSVPENTTSNLSSSLDTPIYSVSSAPSVSNDNSSQKMSMSFLQNELPGRISDVGSNAKSKLGSLMSSINTNMAGSFNDRYSNNAPLIVPGEEDDYVDNQNSMYEIDDTYGVDSNYDMKEYFFTFCKDTSQYFQSLDKRVQVGVSASLILFFLWFAF